MFDDLKEKAEDLVEDHKDDVVDEVKDNVLEKVAGEGLESKLTSFMGDHDNGNDD